MLRNYKLVECFAKEFVQAKINNVFSKGQGAKTKDQRANSIRVLQSNLLLHFIMAAELSVGACLLWYYERLICMLMKANIRELAQLK